jgi:2-polyprenyl-3-methyl-5-hydroxy-6-metoxy-1,4-benzoquinol methylase
MLDIGPLPFCIGPSEVSTNPEGIPEVFGFNLRINEDYQIIEQGLNDVSIALLGQSYSHGNPMGTPSNDTPLGSPYVEDFLKFIKRFEPQEGRILEIGAGTGYLSHRMKSTGSNVVSLEPGRGYEHHWDRFNLEVINDFFPSERIQGKFETVVMYTVLEHIIDVERFLISIKEILSVDGRLILAVPDCEIEIKNVDPSMLIHEHIRFFTKTSISNLLEMNGFEGVIEHSNYGRSLYVAARMKTDNEKKIVKRESQHLVNYMTYIGAQIERARNNIYKLSENGKIGVYCPARLLNVLPLDLNYVFIDDDTEIQGKYYPPFHAKVRNIQEVQESEIETLIIGSRTFAAQILERIPNFGWTVIGMNNLLDRLPE